MKSFFQTCLSVSTLGFVLLLAPPAAVEGASGFLAASSVPAQISLSGASGSFAPILSADGRSVVFLSHAQNLVTNDDRAPFLDVFVRDRTTGTTRLVSVNRTGQGGGNADANPACLSSNGQWVAFASAASNLAGEDPNQVSDVFVHDLLSHTTTLVSRDVTGARSGNGPSCAPAISADGRWIVFESQADNLVTNGFQGRLPLSGPRRNIFVRDVWSNTTALVSVSADGSSSGVAYDGTAASSDSPAITPDGRFVAFSSTATNLILGGMGQAESTHPFSGVFLRDLQAGVTRWASAAVTPTLPAVGAGRRCLYPGLSADGQRVIFKAGDGDRTNVWVFQHDLPTGQSVLLSSNSYLPSAPQISANGRWVVFEDRTNLLVWDAQTGTTNLANLNSDGSPILPGPAHTPVLTADGRSLAFLAAATPPYTNRTLSLATFQVFERDLQAGVTRLVSATQDGVPSAVGCEASVPSLSPDGQCVAFESPDEDLAPGDQNQASDVFLRDLVTGETGLVSARAEARPALTGTGRCLIGPNCLSADGRRLVFASLDNTLVIGDTNGQQDVFFRDLAAGTNALVTQTPGLWSLPVLSADGRHAAFLRKDPSDQTRSGDSVSGTPFCCDLQTGSTAATAVRWDNTASVQVRAPMVRLSPDGRLAAFSANEDTALLTPNVYHFYEAVFVRDFARGSNFLISKTASGSPTPYPDGHCTCPLFSPDGRWLVFASWAPDLGGLPGPTPPGFYLADLGTNSSAPEYLAEVPLRFVGSNALNSSLASSFVYANLPRQVAGLAGFSADSRYLLVGPVNGVLRRTDLSTTNAWIEWTVPGSGSGACALAAGGQVAAYWTTNSSSLSPQIFVKDLEAGTTEAVPLLLPNRADAVQGLAFSSDGSYLVFAARSPGSTRQLLVYDRLQHALLVLSTNQAGAPGNSLSSEPVLGADGRTVVFQSFASDLIPGDYNDHRDIFLLQLGSGDTDHDGLADDWEMAYFGTLHRDGTGDYDGDGMTDSQEFRAGTDPTNGEAARPGSVLRVLAVRPATGGAPTLFWATAPGRTYRVQFKENATDAAWTTLSTEPSLDGSTAWLVDPSADANSQRFYRVVLVP